MHRGLGSATLSQLAFSGESNPNFPWEKSQWDNTVLKKKVWQYESSKEHFHAFPIYLSLLECPNETMLWQSPNSNYTCTKYRCKSHKFSSMKTCFILPYSTLRHAALTCATHKWISKPVAGQKYLLRLNTYFALVNALKLQMISHSIVAISSVDIHICL